MSERNTLALNTLQHGGDGAGRRPLPFQSTNIGNEAGRLQRFRERNSTAIGNVSVRSAIVILLIPRAIAGRRASTFLHLIDY